MESVKININGKEIEAEKNKTILDVVHQFDIDKIPTLCHDGRLEHYTSCFLCVVEVEGFNKLLPSCSTRIVEGMKIHTNTNTVHESRKAALELLVSNHYADCVGPCTNNCPAGVDAQAYIALIASGKYKEALKLVKENNPLPLSIGRVCVRDCETACRRKHVDEAVAVNTMKRYIADQDLVDMWVPEIKPKNGKKVAVIGGGPAGLSCAYYLTLEGYSATILEKLPKLGGMLRYGIPEYRLPKEVLDTEINWITNLGIEVKTGVELGVSTSLKSLSEEYDSVFIGVGAHKATKLGLDGEDKVYGIFRGIDFLRALILDYIPNLKGTVIVVGGGNTAIDAARTALRCGAEKVKIVYRRSINEMPANKEEIEAAQHEGVEILFLTNPKSLIEEEGICKGIVCLKMGLVEGKPGERPKPVPIEGSDFSVYCDYLISAIGQAVDPVFASMDKEISLERWGTVKVNNDTLETSMPGIFAGGDAVTGPFTAITSIAQGKKAAISIMNYLRNGKAEKAEPKFYSFKHKFGKISDKEYSDTAKLARERMKELEVTDRIHCFDEVELGIGESQVYSEAERCLECGCSEYYDCLLRKYCDDYHVTLNSYLGDVQKYKIDKRHAFIALDPNKCINCGKCVRVCSDVLKVSALGFVNRGFKSVVRPAMEKALSETVCISCGNCIDVCPTGAISEKFPFKSLGSLPKEDHETICSFCSLGCKVNFKKIDEDIFYVSNSTNSVKESMNKGFLCEKGRFEYRKFLQKNRVFYPSIKKGMQKLSVSLDEAVDYAEEKIKEIIFKYGSDSVGVIISPDSSNEEMYLLQKFVRSGLENNNISSFSRMMNGSGKWKEPNPKNIRSAELDDLDKCDTIVIVNLDLRRDNLVLDIKVKEAQNRGAEVILISSEDYESTYADLWLDVNKTSVKKIFDPMNELSEDENLHKFIPMVNDQERNVVFICKYSGLKTEAEDIHSINNYIESINKSSDVINGILVIKDFVNSAGLLEMGADADYLPGGISFGDLKEIEHLGELWNSPVKNTFISTELGNKINQGSIKALIIYGEDPYSSQELSELIKNVEFKVVFDSFNTLTAKEADVLFPISNHLEKEGSYFRCDSKNQTSPKIIEGILDHENWEVIRLLASRFPVEMYYSSLKDISREIKLISNSYHLDFEPVI